MIDCSSALNGSPASLGGSHEASRLYPLLGFARPHDGFFRTKGTTIIPDVSRRHAQSGHTDDRERLRSSPGPRPRPAWLYRSGAI